MTVPEAYQLSTWLQSLLVCPRDKSALTLTGNRRDGTLTCAAGHSFPVVQGLPVMLDPDEQPTQHNTTSTLSAVSSYRAGLDPSPVPSFYRVDSTPSADSAEIHPHVQRIIVATCGNMYRTMEGRLTRYPIPHLRLPQGEGRVFLDVGCNWGRWCVAASRLGYRAIGLDPAIEGVMAARDIATQLGAPAEFVVGDGRYLPFVAESVDVAFSYSVLQHFAKSDARRVLAEVSRVLKEEGTSFIQMPNAFGIRSAYNLARRRFSAGSGFEVRYWAPSELIEVFTQEIGPSSITVDGFFGLGIQASDKDLMPLRYQAIVVASEALRQVSERIRKLAWLADSLYIRSAAKRN